MIQKIVRFHTQNNRFVDGSNPRELLKNILTSISSFVDSHDIFYNDNENLWFVHFIKLMETTDGPDFDLLKKFDVMLLINIANKRYDRKALFEICNRFIPFLLEKFNRSRHFDDFLLFIDVHGMILTFSINDDSFVQRMIQFEQEFEKELEFEHSSIFLWKIQLAIFFQNNKNFQRSEYIRSKLLKQLVDKEGFEDVKLELCNLLSLMYSSAGETLLKQINEHHLESHSSRLKYFYTRYIPSKKKL